MVSEQILWQSVHSEKKNKGRNWPSYDRSSIFSLTTSDTIHAWYHQFSYCLELRAHDMTPSSYTPIATINSRYIFTFTYGYPSISEQCYTSALVVGSNPRDSCGAIHIPQGSFFFPLPRPSALIHVITNESKNQYGYTSEIKLATHRSKRCINLFPLCPKMNPHWIEVICLQKPGCSSEGVEVYSYYI